MVKKKGIKKNNENINTWIWR